MVVTGSPEWRCRRCGRSIPSHLEMGWGKVERMISSTHRPRPAGQRAAVPRLLCSLMSLVHGSRRRWVMSRSSVVPVRALPIQGLRVDQGMGRFPTGRRPGPSQALTSGPVSNREHDRPGGPSGRRRRSAFPVPRRPGPRPLAGHLRAVLDPHGSGTPSLKLCFGSSEPFAGVCDPYPSSAAARRRPPRSTGVAVAVAIGRLVAGLLQMAALVRTLSLSG
jgi:hypothetical protein